MEVALVRQSLRLERLAVYHDPDSSPWDLDKAWEHMAPEEWEEVGSELVTLPLMHIGMVVLVEFSMCNLSF